GRTALYEFLKNVLALLPEHPAETAIDHPQAQQGEQGDRPPGRSPHELAALALQALPVGRELAGYIPAQLADLPIQAVAADLQLQRSPGHDAGLALEAPGQAQVHQLQQVQMLDRVARQPLEQLKEFLATDGFIVEAAQQAHLRPGAAVAPGSGAHGLVDGPAEHVAGGHYLAAVAAVLQRLVL